MVTIRQIERLWTAKSYRRLVAELVESRAEGAFSLDGVDRPAFAAALAMVRLDELSQSHLPFYAKLLQTVLATQDRDGGWGDPAITAMCLRALLLDRGDGPAVARGLTYLANLQKDDGTWPAGPIRRMPADPVASLFVLYQLGDNVRFAGAVRFDDAVSWFNANQRTIDRTSRALWEWVSLRCRTTQGASAAAHHAELFAAA